MKREIGHYWVKDKHGEWYMMLWTGNYFITFGVSVRFLEKEFTEINETRLLPPEPKEKQ